MHRPVLVFDGDCGFCQRGIAWYRRHDPAQRLEYLARQSPQRAARYPVLDDPHYQGSIQLVLPDGSIRSGADATAIAMTYLHAPGWRIVGQLMMCWGIRQGARLGYRWIAKNRHRFGRKTTACQLP